jgi:hypothetical protein
MNGEAMNGPDVRMWVCMIMENSTLFGPGGPKYTMAAIFNLSKVEESWEMSNLFGANISPLLAGVQDYWKFTRVGNDFKLYRNGSLIGTQTLEIVFPNIGVITLGAMVTRNYCAEGSVGATYLDNLYLWKAP